MARSLLAALDSPPDARPSTQSSLPAVALYEKHGYRRSETTTLPDDLPIVRLGERLPEPTPLRPPSPPNNARARSWSYSQFNGFNID
jgi:hypothetical protein